MYICLQVLVIYTFQQLYVPGSQRLLLLCADGQKAGGAEALKKAAGRAQLTLEEARQILGVETGATWDAIEKVLAQPSH